ncbi:hypothetical protein Tco_0654894 [Tanacetum coccineum]|uniref:Uncharacterized protein n=1 Tax=Tanacetum coccineum TaxID=301880 RepID=A0ABQ4X542_9ASTR
MIPTTVSLWSLLSHENQRSKNKRSDTYRNEVDTRQYDSFTGIRPLLGFSKLFNANDEASFVHAPSECHAKQKTEVKSCRVDLDDSCEPRVVAPSLEWMLSMKRETVRRSPEAEAEALGTTLRRSSQYLNHRGFCVMCGSAGQSAGHMVALASKLEECPIWLVDIFKGEALVMGYDDMGYELWKPYLRNMMEEDM